MVVAVTNSECRVLNVRFTGTDGDEEGWFQFLGTRLAGKAFAINNVQQKWVRLWLGANLNEVETIINQCSFEVVPDLPK
ncbi:MAG: hypothetical protein WCT19_02960 [Candidatus Paceibacterota bacterium]